MTGEQEEPERQRSGKDEYVLSDEQKDAIAALATTNTYAKQSKWKTLRELPREKQWPFFVQHFLLGTVGVIVAVVAVIAIICSYAFKAPDPELTVAGFDMQNQTAALDTLKKDFAKNVKIDDDRLVDIDGTFSISDSNGYMDDSSKIMAMVTAGNINMMVADKDTFAELVKRQLISPVAQTENQQVVAELRSSGALVDKKGEPIEGDSSASGKQAKAYGLSLDKSATWSGTKGLPDGMILGFSNVVDETNNKRAKEFVTYLKFE